MTESNLIKNRIVVGVDLSVTGDQALWHAAQLASALPQAELHITHVLAAEPNLHDARKLAEIADELRPRLDDLRKHVLTVCAPPAGSKPYAVDSVFHIRIGSPAAAIHQVAVDVDADLIVVGTHGRRGVEKLLLGSVAEELLRTARVPVLIARAKNFEGLAKSDHLEAPRPGQEGGRHGLSDRVHLEFLPRTSHISGLI
ncbi:MAG TPA: universal stress protein [Polyangiales bacterium]|nr:universal stress protein [Polyangiales bacterium]